MNRIKYFEYDKLIITKFGLIKSLHDLASRKGLIWSETYTLNDFIQQSIVNIEGGELQNPRIGVKSVYFIDNFILFEIFQKNEILYMAEIQIKETAFAETIHPKLDSGALGREFKGFYDHVEQVFRNLRSLLAVGIKYLFYFLRHFPYNHYVDSLLKLNRFEPVEDFVGLILIVLIIDLGVLVQIELEHFLEKFSFVLGFDG